jgi:hypothetical protein
MKGGKTGGPQPGTPNKIGAELREAASQSPRLCLRAAGHRARSGAPLGRRTLLQLHCSIVAMGEPHQGLKPASMSSRSCGGRFCEPPAGEFSPDTTLRRQAVSINDLIRAWRVIT